MCVVDGLNLEVEKRGMATKSKSKADDSETVARAVLLELDNVGFAARGIAYETLKRILAEKDVAIGRAQFSQFCVPLAPQRAIPALLARSGHSRLDPAKLAERFAEEYRAALCAPACKPLAGAVELVDTVRKAGVRVGLITVLDHDTATALAGRLGLAEGEATLMFNSSEDRNYPSVDSWLKLAKMTGVGPGLCAALASCGGSCRAALSAGMTCVAIPDDFTSFQDFGGADQLIDRVTPEAIQAILDALAER